jgi:peroxiredoxin
MKTLTTAIVLLLALQDPPLKTLAIGDPAPDFSLPGVDGKTYTLADFSSSKLLIVAFTSNHCPTAQAYEERLKKIVADYKPKGVALVAIQPNSPKGLRLDELGYTELGDTLDEMKIRAREKEFNFPYVDDGDTQKVARAYACKATPHVFLFDEARKLRYAGRIDDSEEPEHVKVSDLRNALDALLAGKDIEVPLTKTFGCSTKWATKEESVKKFMEKLAAEPVTVEPVDEAGLGSLRRNGSGKLRLVSFWSPSRAEDLPALVEINRMYRHRAFEMVTVAVWLARREGGRGEGPPAGPVLREKPAPCRAACGVRQGRGGSLHPAAERRGQGALSGRRPDQRHGAQEVHCEYPGPLHRQEEVTASLDHNPPRLKAQPFRRPPMEAPLSPPPLAQERHRTPRRLWHRTVGRQSRWAGSSASRSASTPAGL